MGKQQEQDWRADVERGDWGGEERRKAQTRYEGDERRRASGTEELPRAEQGPHGQSGAVGIGGNEEGGGGLRRADKQVSGVGRGSTER